MLLHEHHHGVECNATGADKHFHDNETSAQHCFLCQINCPTFDDITSIFQLKIKEISTLVFSFNYTSSFGTFKEYSPPLRGPPSIV